MFRRLEEPNAGLAHARWSWPLRLPLMDTERILLNNCVLPVMTNKGLAKAQELTKHLAVPIALQPVPRPLISMMFLAIFHMSNRRGKFGKANQ